MLTELIGRYDIVTGALHAVLCNPPPSPPPLTGDDLRRSNRFNYGCNI